VAAKRNRYLHENGGPASPAAPELFSGPAKAASLAPVQFIQQVLEVRGHAHIQPQPLLQLFSDRIAD
jgi:hypothetical protein